MDNTIIRKPEHKKLLTENKGSIQKKVNQQQHKQAKK